MDAGNFAEYVAKTDLPEWEESHGTLETLSMWRHKDVRLGPVVVTRGWPNSFYVHHADGWLRQFLRFKDALAFVVEQIGSDEALSNRWERVEIPRI